MREHLIWAYTQGFSIIPLKYDSKIPAIAWKHFTTKKPSYEQYKLWNDDGMFETGYAIITGAISGISVLDVDFRDGGMESLHDSGINVLDIFTWQVDTPNGRHYYFRYDKAARQGTSRIGKGVDIRNDGGVVVGPGSTVNGNTYEWAHEFDPQSCEIAEAPAWLLQGTGRRVDKTLTEFSEPIKNGERNTKLASMVGYLLTKKVPKTYVRGCIEYLNDNYTETPLDRGEIDAILVSISRYQDEQERS